MWLIKSTNKARAVVHEAYELSFYTFLMHEIDTVRSVTRLGDVLDFGDLFKAFGNN